jgi:hypothetical protein
MLEFNPEEPVWRDIAIDGSATLADFHEVIDDAFDRIEPHLYEFITHDEAGIATRSYVPPTAYEGKPSWPEMDDDEIDRFITRAVPDEVSEDAKARFRQLRRDPPAEADAAETTIDSLDPESLQSLFYEFDLGDGWEHHIELEAVREEGPDRDPEAVAAQGEAPPQYLDLDE